VLSDLLKDELEKIGITDIEYVFGWHMDQSHGWLEYQGRIIIDLGIGHFAEYRHIPYIIVGKEKSDFHKKFVLE